MSDEVELNPIDQLDKLKMLLADVPFDVHRAGDTDEEYGYLEGDNVCLTVLNPYQDKELFIDLSDEFTLSYTAFHCHYDPDLYGYKAMVSDLQGVLRNEICAAVIYHGPEKKWLGSASITKSECDKPIKEIFSFVYKQSEFKQKLKAHGGQVQFLFWDPVDDRTIDLPKGS